MFNEKFWIKIKNNFNWNLVGDVENEDFQSINVFFSKKSQNNEQKM